jgi:hypothetical protein
VLQLRDDVDDPEHDRPPWAGLGLVQLRLLVCVPEAHDLVHDPYPDQDDQLPWTTNIGRVELNFQLTKNIS